MKINADILFGGIFAIDMIPFLVYTFFVFKNMIYRLGRVSSGVRGFRPLRWRIVRVGKDDPVARQIQKQLFKWVKICFITWIASFVFLASIGLALSMFGMMAAST